MGDKDQCRSKRSPRVIEKKDTCCDCDILHRQGNHQRICRPARKKSACQQPEQDQYTKILSKSEKEQPTYHPSPFISDIKPSDSIAEKNKYQQIQKKEQQKIVVAENQYQSVIAGYLNQTGEEVEQARQKAKTKQEEASKAASEASEEAKRKAEKTAEQIKLYQTIITQLEQKVQVSQQNSA